MWLKMLRFLKRNTEREQIMELLYLYINLSEREFIEKKGFNFSPNYNFEVNYQNGTYILSSKKQNDCVPNGFFDGDGCISNITAIVGENGSGKTTLLDYILYSGIVSQPDKDKKYYDFFIDKFKYREQIAVYKDKDKLVCYHNMKNFISLEDIECIDITKDSKAYSNMLKNNDGFKNITKISITNSLYSKSVVSTHECLDTITLNPNSINTLKQSFYKKSLGLDNALNGGFYDIPVIVSEYKSIGDFQNLLDIIYLKYIIETDEKSIFENLLNHDLKISFKNVDSYLRDWLEKNNDYKSDERNLRLYYQTWTYALSNISVEQFVEDITLTLYSNLLLEIISCNRIDESRIKIFKDKADIANYIENCIKEMKKYPYFRNAFEEIKSYEECLDKCMNNLCLLPKHDLGYDSCKIVKHRSKELSKLFTLIEKSMLKSKCSFVLRYINIRGLDFSSGERALLNYFSWMHMIPYFKDIQTDVIESTFDNILLLIDEIDLYCHPSWQQKLLDYLIQEVKFNFKDKHVQIMFTTHSPIVLSDMPKSNIIYLKNQNGKLFIDEKEKHNETFGANIYKLFDDAFFLEKQGQVGEFAKKKIQSLINEVLGVKDKVTDSKHSHQLKQRISLIGEPLIREKLLSMLVRAEFDDRMNLREKKIKLYEERIKQLKDEQ